MRVPPAFGGLLERLASATKRHLFIASFCTPEKFSSFSFRNILGEFTPCFVDVVLLGACELMLLAFSACRVLELRGADTTRAKFTLKGWARVSHGAAQMLSVLCAMIPLVQLGARAAVSITAPADSMAPFEVVGFVLGTTGYGFAAAAIATESSVYIPERGWLLRMPLVATFAAQLAKLRGLVLTFNYMRTTVFVYLYIALVVLQAALALWALFLASPSEDSMDSTLVPELIPLGGSSHLSFTFTEGRDPCPEMSANLYSNITFSWLNPLLAVGHQRPLEMGDLWEAPPKDTVAHIGARFQQMWDKQMSRAGSPSIIAACQDAVGGLFLAALPFKLMNDASQFVAPVFINLLLTAISEKQPYTYTYTLAAAMFAGLVVGSICECQYFQRTMRAGFRLRAALVSSVYRKVLHLTAGSRASFSNGFIYNLVTSDADAVQQVCQQLFTFVSSPLRILVAMFLLYQQLGVAAFATLFILLILMPMQLAMARLSTRILREGMVFSDERTKLESDAVSGIEAVKTQGWEDFFLRTISRIRATELSKLWKGFIISAINTLVLQTVPTVVTICTFAVYVLLGNTLTAAQAFTALSLFNVLRMPLFQLPMLVQQALRANVSLTRLQDFLAAAEQGPIEHQMRPYDRVASESVKFKGSVRWAPDAAPVLSDVDLEARNGQLVVVLGPTGGGKSSLLSALLGLTDNVPGNELKLRGAIAYVSQQAFIFGGTVRENIVFESGWLSERYEAALDAANLHPDLQQFAAGDSTELGEGGINVSGGQKQRIALARAVYANADVVLLDDPLSALDSKVGRRVFDRCIKGAMAGCTRILVTNQLQYVRDADVVLVLHEGKVAEQGGYKELMAKNGLLTELMKDVQVDEEENSDASKSGTSGKKKDPHGKPPRPAGPARQRLIDTHRTGRLVEQENRETGVVGSKVLMAYVRALGGQRPFLALVGMYVSVEGMRVASSVWLAVWTGSGEEGGTQTEGYERLMATVLYAAAAAAGKTALFYLGIYCAISFGQVLLAAAAQFLMRALSLRASRSLHDGMLRSLLSAPMAFFHTNPSGRIINRLTKDTNDIDRNLAAFAAMFFSSILTLVSTAALIGTVTPFLLPFLVPVLLIFALLYLYFQESVREVKRLDSISRSPIFTSVNNALLGLPTIRSYRRETALYNRNAALIDTSSAMQLCNQSLNRWLSIRLEFAGAVIALAAAALTIEQQGNAAWSGLVLSYALQMTSMTTMVVRLASVAENSFNAVERVDEFSHIEPEGNQAPPQAQVRLPAGFPTAGKIEYKNVKMRYRDHLPLVLRGLSFKIDAGSRVGIVGRTGAGKSTIINTLFRLQELAEGQIFIDGVDISKAVLSRLRSSMALIPQVPVIFTGTIRSNLAPTGTFTDYELWSALSEAHLEDAIRLHPEGLEQRVVEGGAPLAMGQRQLVALARALLKRSRVLVLDEATANVDMNTDALIQSTIRERFREATTIAVAHRLHTVIECDKILVMDAGTAAEFASPAELLKKKDGIFASMVDETGASTARFLRSVASGNSSLDTSRSIAAEAAITAIARPNPVAYGACMTEKIQKEAEAAGRELEELLTLLEDQEETERMLMRIGEADAVGDGGADVTANVSKGLQRVGATLASLRTKLAKVRQHLVKPAGWQAAEEQAAVDGEVFVEPRGSAGSVLGDLGSAAPSGEGANNVLFAAPTMADIVPMHSLKRFMGDDAEEPVTDSADTLPLLDPKPQ